MHDAVSLHRFLEAQETAYAVALTEIQRGRKASHWMWYIFPQIQGLGFSATSRHYALASAHEAEAYARHPVLGARLVHLGEELLALESNDATRILGSPDDLKLRSCMTLFGALPGAHAVFQRVLDKFFGGKPDEHTLRLLRQ